MLVGRSRESAQIDGLLNEVRGGAGRALAVLGEPGIGKTALLQYAGRQAAAMTRLSIVGVAAEAALPYAGLHELLRPVLWGLEALPARQSRAIKLALGADGDDATDALAVYAGVLALLAEAAAREPLIVIVDDAHWLDIETVNALAFVARRIEDESIGVLLGARSSEPFEMHGVPQLRLGGVDLAAATELVGRAGYDVEPEVVRALRDGRGQPARGAGAARRPGCRSASGAAAARRSAHGDRERGAGVPGPGRAAGCGRPPGAAARGGERQRRC